MNQNGNAITYQPDLPDNSLDMMIATMSGPEPEFDAVTRDFLMVQYEELKGRCLRGGLLEFSSLGRHVPWLYRLTFHTLGLVRDGIDSDVQRVNRHDIALRFLPDYLRHADRFEMLQLVEPHWPPAFHPNISPRGAVCVEVYPGQSLTEICQSLHELLRWRLRQYDERDALNPLACAWGRENISEPIDDRPLFGRQLQIDLEPLEE